MMPPFNVNFEEMKRKEAQNHFDWFISQVPERMNILNKYSNVDLDFSPKSLVELWEYFIPLIQLVDLSPLQEEEISKNVPDGLRKVLLNKMNRNGLTTETSAISLDIATYFGEYFLRNHHQIKWGFVTKPRSLFYRTLYQ
ncbi:hypothetical protein SAMN04487895_11299 [Paenibacillus sophorae]|uniref:Uncharacterized protein n=2 Tax=Paenibacillus sophorae TaxID=1333845 RepID=A0A1H8ST73_9BACL|nr:hypothetical protein [Paenibacillus sophorae]QWU15557.1 hypothetical protein KP014_27520 [Paenibacillus sophorae]SEO81960.1 hypothetical protein SAMN04487895_11299 [Paenibacillus sophorae]